MLTYDYKSEIEKRARAVPSQDAEALFFEQSYTLLENNAKPLMTPEFRVGFEVVYKNEELTQMVALYIFKVDKTLLYAPVFFNNGKIKGTILLYMTDKKLITLLDPDWCDYTIQHYNPGQGKPISARERSNMKRQGIFFDRLSSPPGTYKSAALKAWKEISESAGNLEDLFNVGSDKKAGYDIRRCLSDLGPNATLSLGAMYQEDPTFEKKAFSFVPIHLIFTDEVMGKVHTAKSAAAAPPPFKGIRIHLDPATNKQASTDEKSFNRGYSVEDTRDQEKLAKMVMVNASSCMESGSSDLVQNIRTVDGKKVRCMVAPSVNYYTPVGEGNSDDGYGDDECYPFDSHRNLPKIYVELDGEHRMLKTNKRGVMETLEGMEKLDLDSYTKLKAGTSYILYDAYDGKFKGSPFTVKTKTKGSGFEIFDINCCPRPSSEGENHTNVIRINKDSEKSNIHSGMLGNKMRFIPVGVEGTGVKSLPNVVGMDDIESVLRDTEYTKLKVKKASSEFLNEYTIQPEHGTCLKMTKQGSFLYLMAGHGLSESRAEELIEAASETKDGAEVWIKGASNVRFNTGMEFFEDFDPDLGVPIEGDNSQIIASEADYDTRQDGPRFGDVQKINSGDMVDSLGGPRGIDNLAKHVGLRQIFDQGVIGTLLKEFDANSVIDKYLPDLQVGLDRIGRILFLIYWKPDDFGRMFGSDDVGAMESSLEGTFKGMGRLVLDLLQKVSKPKTSVTDE